MARINLLPWRDEKRKELRKQFVFIAAGSGVLMLLVILYVHIYVSGLISDQNSRNQYLQQQIGGVNSKIKEIEGLEKQKQQLLARMKVIEQLQQNRPAVVHLFESLAKAVPDGLYLTSLTQSGTSLTITGVAQSNARVSSFMRNLDNSRWFENPVLDVIQVKDKGEQSRTFVLRVTQADKKAEGEKDNGT